MHFLIWAISVILTGSVMFWTISKAVREAYEERIEQINNDWSSEMAAKQADHDDLIYKRDKEITNLTLENITLTHNNEDLKKKLTTLEQKYEIKTSVCLGLQKNARMWHESYEELEANIDSVKERCSKLMSDKEIEHQKEIEDLTRYYKEQIQKYTNPVVLEATQNAD